MARTRSQTDGGLERFGSFAEAFQAATGNRTQLAVSQQLGLSQSRISRWVTGESLPDATSIPVLARFMGVSETELVLFLYARRFDTADFEAKGIRNSDLLRRYAELVDRMREDVLALNRRIDDLEAELAERTGSSGSPRPRSRR